MSTEVPEPWASAMIAAGMTDPRYSRPVPSRSRLADASDTTTSTISAMIAGERDTDGKILERVATALRLEPQVVFGWANRTRTEGTPFLPHRDADLLTAEEQGAVNELIRLLALPKKQGGERGGDTPATIVPPSDEDGGDVNDSAVDLLVRRYLKQAENDPDVAERALAHDGAKGSNSEPATWGAALTALSEMPRLPKVPIKKASRKNVDRPPKGPGEQGAD